MPVRRPVHVGPLAGGADGVAEALRLAPHPPQAAAGEQALHRELHGDADREVDELALARESGECLGGGGRRPSPLVLPWKLFREKVSHFAIREFRNSVNEVPLGAQPLAAQRW